MDAERRTSRSPPDPHAPLLGPPGPGPSADRAPAGGRTTARPTRPHCAASARKWAGIRGRPRVTSRGGGGAAELGRLQWLRLGGVGKMAPPATERGLKSVVWQSECGGAGAEREGQAFLPRAARAAARALVALGPLPARGLAASWLSRAPLAPARLWPGGGARVSGPVGPGGDVRPPAPSVRRVAAARPSPPPGFPGTAYCAASFRYQAGFYHCAFQCPLEEKQNERSPLSRGSLRKTHLSGQMSGPGPRRAAGLPAVGTELLLGGAGRAALLLREFVKLAAELAVLGDRGSNHQAGRTIVVWLAAFKLIMA